MSTYAKIEHSLYDNPKIVGLSCEAFRAYVEGILYSGKNLTDGFLDERIVSRMWGTQVAEELTTNDSVNPSWKRVEGGWLIYGFTERQNTKEDVDATRERKRAAANARWNKAKSTNDAEPMQTAYKTNAEPIQKAYKADAKAMPDTDTDTDTDTYTDKDKELKRGTRLPKPFVLTSEMINWAVEKHPLVDFNLQTESFIDYWTAQPGQKGVKSDWVATWRNWIRNSRPTLKPVVADANDWMIAKPIELS